jgi:hypothetical protein
LTSAQFIEKTKEQQKILFTRDYTKSFRLRQLKKKLKFPKPEIHRRNTGYAVDIWH